MNEPNSDRNALPPPLRLLLWSGPTLWLASILDALLRSIGTPDFDGFHWIFYRPPAFDYWDYIGRFYLLHRPEFFTAPGYPWYYPAPTVFLLDPLYLLGRLAGNWRAGYLAYVVLALGGFLLVMLAIGRHLRRAGSPSRTANLLLLSITLFSWPLYFVLQRGNIEALTWLFLAATIWAYARQRWLLMSVLLGLAAAFKFYPAFCFALLLPPKRFKELAIGLLTFALSTLLALRFLERSLALAWHGVSTGIASWVRDYARSFGPDSATYDHSLYELLKVLTRPLHPVYSALLPAYLFGLGLFALVVFFSRVRHLPRTNQLLFLVTAAVCFAPASLDYTLINLYVPLAWLTAALVEQPSRSDDRSLRLAFLCFALILGPETFIQWHGITLAGLFKTLPLLGLLAIGATTPLPDLNLSVSPPELS